MYDRRHDENELSFEASGALMDAALIMRDRETDSWWSIMTGNAIGGKLDGAPLVEMPVGEKMTWGEWRRRHPQSKVLSHEGKQYEPNNPYDNYFTGEKTFRDMTVEDQRLPAKESIYSFRWNGRAYAVTHSRAEGGALLELEGEKRRLLIYRDPGASVYASSWAFLVPHDIITNEDEGLTMHKLVLSKRPLRLNQESAGTFLMALSQADASTGVERLTGFDTFWYTWVAVHQETQLFD